MPSNLIGKPKAERDQERIILALEQIANTLRAINSNLAVLAKAAAPNGAVSPAERIGT